LADLLLSLRAQSLAAFDLVIVDDASTDPRSAAMREAMAQSAGAGGELVRLDRNVGLAAARNRGIERTSAPLVACLDADDVLAPEFLRATVEALERTASVGFVYFDHYEFGAVSRHVRSREFDLDELVRQNFVVASAPFRRVAWAQVGGYREDMVHGYEDWDLWLRLARGGWPGKRLRRTLFYYRKREGSLLEHTLLRHDEEARVVRDGAPVSRGGDAG
jgi:GT2 family glycosyltransferase